MENKIKVVLDTNCILSSISINSIYHIIIDSLYEGKFILCVSNEILMEYEEKLSEIFNEGLAENFIGAVYLLENVEFVNIYFKLSLISSDLDDNKFCDCYVSSSSNYLVTNDKHFKPLKSIPFPKINLVNIVLAYFGQKLKFSNIRQKGIGKFRDTDKIIFMAVL